MNDVVKLTIALTLVCACSGLILALTHTSTAPLIEAQKTLLNRQAVERVFPTGTQIADAAGSPPLPARYWIGSARSTVIGYAFPVESRGYSSIIRYIVGVDTSGIITGMAIVAQAETPGLGTRMEEYIEGKSIWNRLSGDSNKARVWFTEQFKGTSVFKPFSINKTAEWHALSEHDKMASLEKNTISAISGSTISTRAIIAGIEKTVVPCVAVLRRR